MSKLLISGRPVKRRRCRLFMRASTTLLPRHGNPTAVVHVTAFADSAPEKSSATTCRALVPGGWT